MKLPIKVEVKGTGKVTYTKELIEKQLARTDLPENERQYLLQLKARKFN